MTSSSHRPLHAAIRTTGCVALLALLAACVDNPTTVEGTRDAGAPSFHLGYAPPAFLAGLGSATYAEDVNDAGLVVGISYTAGGGDYRAVAWIPGAGGAYSAPLQLGGLLSSPEYSSAFATSTAGWIVGAARYSGYLRQAVLWRPNGAGGYLPAQGLGSPYAGGSEAMDLNAAGVVVGNGFRAGSNTPQPVVWTPTGGGGHSPAALLMLRGSWAGSANAVNAAGVIVGRNTISDPQQTSRAVAWRPGMYASLPIRLLSLPGADTVDDEATDINGSGVAVGYSNEPGAAHHRAVVWRPRAGGTYKEPLPLPTPAGYWSRAIAIADDGRITGYAVKPRDYSSPEPQAPYQAVVWEPLGGTRYRLRLLPAAGTQDAPGGISSTGQVVGRTVHSGAWRAVSWGGQPNSAPVADAGGPYQGAVPGARIVLNGSATDADADSLAYSWDVDGDGISDGRRPQRTLQYDGPGTYQVVLTVRDEHGAVDADTTVVTIHGNTAPIAVIDNPSPLAASEGVVVFGSTGSSDPDGDPLTYSWYHGDDGTHDSAPNARHAFVDQGTYTVRLIVIDAWGARDTATVEVQVSNAPPTAGFAFRRRVEAGQPFTLSLREVREPSAADRAAGLQAAFDCGGGYGAFGTAMSTACPARPDGSAFQVRATIRDKDGGQTEYTGTVNAP